MQDNPRNVISLRSRALDRAEARAVDAVLELAGEAMAALDDVLARGDVDMIYTAHRAINRAIAIALDHRLRTIA